MIRAWGMLHAYRYTATVCAVTLWSMALVRTVGA
jgi:hypothetical protein